MKFAIQTVSALALLGGLIAMRQDSDRIVILTGDSMGYLAPCGCSSPMMGGILREGSVIRSLSIPGHTTLLANGGLVESAGRQDELKAETLAESLADLGVAAINIGVADARLGPGSMLQLSQLSGEKLISLSIDHPHDQALGATVVSGPFLVGGVVDPASLAAAFLGDARVPLDAAVKELVDAAAEARLRPILMLQGSRETAVRLAKSFPALALIEYSSTGQPPSSMETIGTSVLATVGDHGKYLVKLEYRDGHFSGYKNIPLGPEYRDDPVISRFYKTYLGRVKSEKLLDKVPRGKTAAYSGSWACMPCHGQDAHVWKASAHRFAMLTLAKMGHDFDPDCVSCHVTGLASVTGFRSESATPQLSGVGCESCHGPGLAHARAPKTVRLARLTERACIGCHNPLNSPNFEFSSYWPKVRH